MGKYNENYAFPIFNFNTNMSEFLDLNGAQELWKRAKGLVENVSNELQDIIVFTVSENINDETLYFDVTINGKIITSIEEFNEIVNKNNFIAKLCIEPNNGIFCNLYFIDDTQSHFYFDMTVALDNTTSTTVSIYFNNEKNKFIGNIQPFTFAQQRDVDRELNKKANASDVYTKTEIDNKDFASKTQVDQRFQELIGAAPEALDTLEEIAEKLQDGDDIHAALVNSISEKATKEEVEALKTLTNNYCFNGVVDYFNIDDCKKEGFYLILNGTDGYRSYDILTVSPNEFRNELTQVFYKTNQFGINSFQVLIRVFDKSSNSWSNWSQCKYKGIAEVANTLGVNLLNNESLNTITGGSYATNIYYAEPNNSCSFKPGGVKEFFLIVYGDCNGFIVQVLHTKTETYKRINDGTTWTNWKKLITEDDVATENNNGLMSSENFKKLFHISDIVLSVIGHTSFDATFNFYGETDNLELELIKLYKVIDPIEQIPIVKYNSWYYYNTSTNNLTEIKDALDKNYLNVNFYIWINGFVYKFSPKIQYNANNSYYINEIIPITHSDGTISEKYKFKFIITDEYVKFTLEKISDETWVGTQSEYDAIKTKDTNTLYFIKE